MGHDIFATVRGLVVAALRDLVPELPDEVAARVEVTPAREAGHGDMATNAALVAARAARRKPAEIAAGLVAALAGEALIAEAVAAGPGFVNLRLRPEA
jgi:arginyl-tRNA synthetase